MDSSSDFTRLSVRTTVNLRIFSVSARHTKPVILITTHFLFRSTTNGTNFSQYSLFVPLQSKPKNGCARLSGGLVRLSAMSPRRTMLEWNSFVKSHMGWCAAHRPPPPWAFEHCCRKPRGCHKTYWLRLGYGTLRSHELQTLTEFPRQVCQERHRRARARNVLLYSRALKHASTNWNPPVRKPGFSCISAEYPAVLSTPCTWRVFRARYYPAVLSPWRRGCAC
jgi:hypothetical protein